MEDRPATAEEVASALEGMMTETEQARPAPAPATERQITVASRVHSTVAHAAEMPTVAEQELPEDVREAARNPQSRFGRYILVRHYASGGMSRIFLAYDPGPAKRYVMLKLLNDQVEPARAEQEARLLAKLEHPNIIPLYEAGLVDGIFFVAMRFIDGESVSRRFEGIPFARRIEETLKIAAPVGEALRFAHERGILHRDVKPGNILLDRRNTAYLADFGLARDEAVSALTASGQIMGTPSYMAPEQMVGSHVTASADIFGFGATMYDLLTGGPPWRGNSAAEIFRNALEGNLIPPSRVNPKITRRLEALVLKAMEREPSRRFASMADLLAELRACSKRRWWWF
jgi:serine/threonine-protein kinase